MKKPCCVTFYKKEEEICDMGVGKDEEKTRIQFEKNTQQQNILGMFFFC